MWAVLYSASALLCSVVRPWTHLLAAIFSLFPKHLTVSRRGGGRLSSLGFGKSTQEGSASFNVGKQSKIKQNNRPRGWSPGMAFHLSTYITHILDPGSSEPHTACP